MVSKENRIVFTFILFVTSFIKLYSQDTVNLSPGEFAIIDFQIKDDCPCSHLTLEMIDGSYENFDLLLVSIDSVEVLHIADCFIDEEYLINDIKYLVVPDSLKLLKDTTYVASVSLSFDMGYVVLREFYKKNLIYLEFKYARAASFSYCPPDNKKCLNTFNNTQRCIDECNSKYEFDRCNQSD